MRRFLTLVCLLCWAIPAGVSISGCTRNPAAKYCPLNSGYDLKTTQVAYILLQPQETGISLAYGQTMQVQSPQAYTCLETSASVGSNSYTYGTTNNQLVDISPTGLICAGTWNRNTGGGIANYTYCNAPVPAPSTNGLPYSVAYITATADSVTSNPVAVYIHPTITSVSLVGPQQCVSQSQVAQLDEEACYAQNGKQVLLCAPSSVTTSASPNLACPLPYVNGVSGAQVPLSSIPSCESTIGIMSFTAGNAQVASINSTNNQITAEQPGTTVITGSIAGSGSAAGYFSTCPPESISVKLANGSTSGTISQGVPQNLTTTVYDNNVTACPPSGCPITGLTLAYQSTNPVDISASAGGAITTSFPGVSSLYAVCQPPTCNPSPINEIGVNGTGLSIASNPVDITTPGTASDYLWFAAPGQSQYFVPLEVLTGALGANVRLPYVPNSMQMDRNGNNLYFGSAHELMVYSTSTDAITTQNTSVPGVVLAVSPDNTHVLINDQARHLFYVYPTAGTTTTGGTSTSSASPISFPGMGNAAEWTPDSQTLYITDNAELNTPASCSATGPLQITGHTNTLYVYNTNTGWSTYPLPPSPLPASDIPTCSTPPNVAPPTITQTPALMIPGVGAYLRGTPTVVHTWCPAGTVGNGTSITFYPEGDNGSPAPVQSDALASTIDGDHILTASLQTGGGITLNDIGVTIPSVTTDGFTTPSQCPVSTDPVTGVQTLMPLNVTYTVNPAQTLTVSATTVDQVVTGSTPVAAGQTQGSSLAFVTYSGASTGASLPYYLPATSGAGSLNYVSLTGSSSITGPIAGAFSPDNTTFFVSTAGDNMIHYIAIPNAITGSSTPTDSKQVSPNLPACTPVSAGGVDAGCTYPSAPAAGTVVPATVITVKPRSVT